MKIIPSGIDPEGYSKVLARISRWLPGLKWDSSARTYRAYPDAVEIAVSEMTAKGLRVTGKIDHPVFLGSLKIERLAGYQADGVKFVAKRAHTGALLADDMGLGKTAQAIRVIQSLDVPAVVVMPAYARDVWLAEINRWWEGLGHPNIFVCRGTKPDLRIPETTQIIFCHYDVLHAWLEKIQDWNGHQKYISVFDEIQYIASEKARRSVACRNLAGRAAYRVGLSGTPMTNRPRDLWHILETLSPGRFGTFFQFALRYCDAHQVEVPMKDGPQSFWNFDGASHLDELKSRLTHMMLRRTAVDVGLQLPPRSRQLIWLEPKKIGPAKIPGIRNRRALREALDRAADAKLPEALRLIRDVSGKAVIFCWRRNVAEWLAAELGGPERDARLIHGGILVPKRKAILEAARAAESGYLVVTIDSCATAIDLSFASVGVFVELTYEPWELLQAEAREFRRGQKWPTRFLYLLMKGSADELVADAVIRKLDEFQAKLFGDGGEGLSLDLKGGSADKVEEEILDEIFGHLENGCGK